MNMDIVHSLQSVDVRALPDLHSKVDHNGDIWVDAPEHRANLASRLIDFINEQRAPLTIGMNGEWGTGKTFFLTRFVEEVKRRGGFCVYLNAWKGDAFQLPLLYVYCEIVKQLEGSRFEIVDGDAWNTFVGKAGKFIGNIAGVATGGLYKTLLEGLDDIDRESIASQYNDESKAQRFVQLQIEGLSSFIHKKTHTPLIVVVDELDRCRPTYAIEMLEQIKHTFSIPNSVFLIGADFGQLCKTINSVYGAIEADKYLDRFLQYRFDLPRYKPEEYFDIVWRRMRLDEVTSERIKLFSRWMPSDTVKEVFKAILAAHPECTLRDVELILRAYNIGLSMPLHSALEGIVIAALATFKVLRRGLYSEIKQKPTQEQDWFSLCFAGKYDSQEYKEIVKKLFNRFFLTLQASNSREAGKAYYTLDDGELELLRRCNTNDVNLKLIDSIIGYMRESIEGVDRNYKEPRLVELMERLDFTLGSNIGMLDIRNL